MGYRKTVKYFVKYSEQHKFSEAMDKLDVLAHACHILHTADTKASRALASELGTIVRLSIAHVLANHNGAKVNEPMK